MPSKELVAQTVVRKLLGPLSLATGNGRRYKAAAGGWDSCSPRLLSSANSPANRGVGRDLNRASQRRSAAGGWLPN